MDKAKYWWKIRKDGIVVGPNSWLIAITGEDRMVWPKLAETSAYVLVQKSDKGVTTRELTQEQSLNGL